jgi:arabinan endo-1,5-alpha-L-arabinosidase
MQLSDIQLRDPFVVPCAEEGVYYLFGSTDPDIWNGPGVGFDSYRSADLVEWTGPVEAFRPPEGFWSPGCYWAPEVYPYDDAWFMLATFTGVDGHRGTQVLRSSRPEGPYEPWSDGPITPDSWQCLDGSLHVDGGGPWLVFCHEFLQCGDGEICVMRIDDALRQPDGEASVLFRASEASWANDVHVTDGPFVYRSSNGDLSLLWSSFSETGYALGIARSESGSILGPWAQDAEPLWEDDGGHGMLFHSFDDQLYLALHSPNVTPHERALLVPLVEENGNLSLA